LARSAVVIAGRVKRRLIGQRRLGRAADLADVLQRRRLDLVGGGRRLEVMQDADVATHRGDPGDRRVKRRLIGQRRLGRAADLADVLQRRRLDLVGGGRRLEVMQDADVATHAARVARRW
jgi:hypothetical protein